MSSDIVKKARRFAMTMHGDQVRKYTGEPYWYHCHRVAEMVGNQVGDTEILNECMAAAYLHDVVEDTDATHRQIKTVFGPVIAGLVYELTSQYTKEQYPHLNRRLRKWSEAVRLSSISTLAKMIKRYDIQDNIKDIVVNDPKFAITYLREKATVLEAMGFSE